MDLKISEGALIAPDDDIGSSRSQDNIGQAYKDSVVANVDGENGREAVAIEVEDAFEAIGDCKCQQVVNGDVQMNTTILIVGTVDDDSVTNAWSTSPRRAAAG